MNLWACEMKKMRKRESNRPEQLKEKIKDGTKFAKKETSRGSAVNTTRPLKPPCLTPAEITHSCWDIWETESFECTAVSTALVVVFFCSVPADN